jgi:flavin reductase (DIM6/NTAB) family NADH-FMN oxidoreductase RutF
MFSSNGPKDSATFATSAGEFVWNLATYALREQMNLTSKALPRGESEFAFGGLEMAPSRLVAPPRVAATPVALECRVTQRVEVGEENIVTFGQVVGVHVDERFIVDGRVDTAAMQPIARCGYRGDYAVVTELFEMLRP